MIKLSERQQPVVSKLFLLVDEAEAVAAAIVDNSIDELQHIPAETRLQLKTQVAKINELINQA